MVSWSRLSHPARRRRIEMDYVTKDSGERQKFPTGAQRDIQAGKGRYDLFPWLVLPQVIAAYHDERLDWDGAYPVAALADLVGAFASTGDRGALKELAAKLMVIIDGNSETAALKRLAGACERGAQKYGPRNWEKGIPLSRYLDSAFRHILQHEEGKTDEDHAGQALWNVLGLLQTEEMIRRGILPESLRDLPDYRGRSGTSGGVGTPMPFLGFEADHEATKGV
jgi:hypothetical protein